MNRLKRTLAEHPAPPPQKKRPEPKTEPGRYIQYHADFPPRPMSTIRLERVGSDAVEVWIDSSGRESHLLANLTKRAGVPGTMYYDWWNLSSSNAAFIWWVEVHNHAATVATPEVLKVLAENFLVYLRSLKQLQEHVV